MGRFKNIVKNFSQDFPWHEQSMFVIYFHYSTIECKWFGSTSNCSDDFSEQKTRSALIHWQVKYNYTHHFLLWSIYENCLLFSGMICNVFFNYQLFSLLSICLSVFCIHFLAKRSLDVWLSLFAGFFNEFWQNLLLE